jgi:hypothetical protein
VDRRKAKAMAAIAASSAHTMRKKPTPNADPDGPAPVVMHLADGKTPYQAARHLLDGAERRNRDTVLCREIVLSASPSYFRPGRENLGGVFDLDKVKAWATASLAWAKRQWPDQLASFVIHTDEQNVHAHLLVVPRVKSAAGAWKLNSKALFDRERLRELQTGYGEALAPLGIRRGEPGSQAEHSEVKQFYGVVQAAKQMPQRAPVPPAPKAPMPPANLSERLWCKVLGQLGIESEHERAERAHREQIAAWRAEARKVKDRNDQVWRTMQVAASMAPLARKQRRSRESPVSTPGSVVPTIRRARGPS